MKPRRPGLRGLLALVLLVCLGVLVRAGTSAQAMPPLPHEDAFYHYGGTTPLARIARGTILKERSVHLSLAGKLSTPLRAEQLLYRTVDELGRPAVTVTTVVSPLGAPTGVVGYLSFYDALGDQCDPSYTLHGGYPGNSTIAQQADAEEGLIGTLAAQGYAVTVPDFEGEGMHWLAGQQSGKSTLDAVRATERYLHETTSTRVGLFGYSGGSIAGEWAAELAPTYAPRLHIAGTAIGGIPVDLAHNLRYVDGSRSWSGVIPAFIVALGRSFGVNLLRYASAYGRRTASQVRDQCIASFYGSHPGLTVRSLVKPKYHDFLHIPVVERILNHLIMGTAPGHPTSPMLMAVGNADGIGDGVMLVPDVEALAREYCRQGVRVKLDVLRKQDHTQAGQAFLGPAEAWLLQRMLGVPAPSGCAGISRGSSVAPLS